MTLAFTQGTAALKELSLLPRKDFSPEILSAHNARTSPELEEPGLTIITEDEIRRRKWINQRVQAYLTDASIAYSDYQQNIDSDKDKAERAYGRYIKSFAQYKEAYKKIEAEQFGNNEGNELDAAAAYAAITAADEAIAATNAAIDAANTAAEAIAAAGVSYSPAAGSGYGSAVGTSYTPAAGSGYGATVGASYAPAAVGSGSGGGGGANANTDAEANHDDDDDDDNKPPSLGS